MVNMTKGQVGRARVHTLSSSKAMFLWGHMTHYVSGLPVGSPQGSFSHNHGAIPPCSMAQHSSNQNRISFRVRNQILVQMTFLRSHSTHWHQSYQAQHGVPLRCQRRYSEVWPTSLTPEHPWSRTQNRSFWVHLLCCRISAYERGRQGGREDAVQGLAILWLSCSGEVLLSSWHWGMCSQLLGIRGGAQAGGRICVRIWALAFGNSHHHAEPYFPPL